MAFMVLAILILMIYLMYGKKIVHLVGRKFLSIAAIVLLFIFFVKSGLLGGLGRFISFLILKIEESIGMS